MLSTAKNALGQSFNIPSPTLTEKNLPSQVGRVHIVTGGYSGVGQELSRILYSANAVVYIAGRSPEKADKAIAAIKQAVPDSKGRLEFMKVDFSDLPSIKPGVDAFLAKESRLDVLTNNAGVMMPPAGSKTAQNHELQVGTNVLGSYLLTSLLRPILTKTAASSPPGSTRVTWAGSLAVDLMSPKPGGITWESETGGPKTLGRQSDYGQSKAGNLLLANESAKKWGTESGVLHLAWNPGNLKTELQRHSSSAQVAMMNMMLHPAVFGAYTELYAGWSEDLSMADAGKFIVPWGRVGTFRPDIAQGIKGKSEGGLGTAERLYEWCEGETKAFA